MPYCPNCLTEYVKDTRECEDCGVPLLPGRRTPLRLGRILTATVEVVLSEGRPDLVCVAGGELALIHI